VRVQDGADVAGARAFSFSEALALDGRPGERSWELARVACAAFEVAVAPEVAAEAECGERGRSGGRGEGREDGLMVVEQDEEAISEYAIALQIL